MSERVYDHGEWCAAILSSEQNEKVDYQFEHAPKRSLRVGPFEMEVYEFEHGPLAAYHYLAALVLMPDGEQWDAKDNEYGPIAFETIFFPDGLSLLMFLKEYGGQAK